MDQPTLTPDTPVIALMPYGFLQQLQDLVSAPETLNGAQVVRKAAIIRALMEAVTVEQYNNVIINKILSYQAEQRAAAVTPPPPSAPVVGSPTPIVANRAANFVPNRVKLEEQKKAELPKRSHKKKEPEKSSKSSQKPMKAAAAKKVTPKKKAPPAPPKHRW